jgi:hypothetical protein
MQDHQDRLPAGTPSGTNEPHDQNPAGVWQATEVSDIKGRRTMAGREIARVCKGAGRFRLIGDKR